MATPKTGRSTLDILKLLNIKAPQLRPENEVKPALTPEEDTTQPKPESSDTTTTSIRPEHK